MPLSETAHNIKHREKPNDEFFTPRKLAATLVNIVPMAKNDHRDNKERSGFRDNAVSRFKRRVGNKKLYATDIDFVEVRKPHGKLELVAISEYKRMQVYDWLFPILDSGRLRDDFQFEVLYIMAEKMNVPAYFFFYDTDEDNNPTEFICVEIYPDYEVLNMTPEQYETFMESLLPRKINKWKAGKWIKEKEKERRKDWI